MSEFYTRSSGERVRIAEMDVHHLRPAHAKLIRERTNASRDPEIEAMGKRLAELAEEHLEQQVSQ